jgi:hypothetical protein
MKITSAIFSEAFLFTCLTLTYILGYKMLASFVDRKGNFLMQLNLYIISCFLLILSSFDLPDVDNYLYTILTVIYLGISPYYTSLKEVITYEKNLKNY